MKTGIARITDERARQISAERWTPEHDDAHDRAEIELAARSYELHSDTIIESGRVCKTPPPFWPWGLWWWKPTEDPARGYEKAGALYQAEGDRRLRLGDRDGFIAMNEKAEAVGLKIDALPNTEARERR